MTELTFHAENEFVHCSSVKSVRVDECEKDPEWDAKRFSDEEEGEDGRVCEP